MKNGKSKVIALSLLLLLVLMGFSACDKKDEPTTPTAPSGFITGTVFAQGKSPLSGVTVKAGTITTTTDTYGMYLLSGVPTGTNVKVDFEKTGLIPLQKTVTVLDAKTSYLSCTLFSAFSATFPANTGDTVSEGGADVIIPPDAFVDANNQPFTGTVKTEMKFFDPTNAEHLEAFPGTFTGMMNGVATSFESYGFISATFSDAAKAGSKLQLAPGKKAELKANIPWALQSAAPATIPMWYYDEAAGTWIAEGTATKVGNRYEGEVSHFTYWNFDHPIQITDQSTLKGKVILNGTEQTPVVGAQVVATGVNYAGYTRVYSDANGNFSITVKASAQVRVRAYHGQNSSPANSAVIDTPAGGAEQNIGNVVITDLSYYVSGKIVNAANQPIPNCYGSIMDANTNSQLASLYTDVNGNFQAQVYPSKAVASVKFQVSFQNATLSSAPLQFTVPQIGQVYNFPEPIVVLDRGYTLTGTMVYTDSLGVPNQPYANRWGNISLSPSGGQYGNFSTDESGNFSARIDNPRGKGVVSVVFSAWGQEGRLYSSAIQYTEPQAGGTHNIPNPINLGVGGAITGLVKDGTGALITNASIQFQGSSGGPNEEVFGMIDDNGRFTVYSAPNAVFTGMQASVWANNNSYRSASMTLTFPAAGAVSDIGVLTVILQTNPTKK